jgi:uncharacterized membrane protein YesL
MGFFSNMYNKEGPGVDKEAPQKHRFFLFFELLFRKFWQLITLNLIYFLFCIPIVTIGPATAGFTYVLRNFSREEHSFVWMDFIDNFKKNWKQSFLVSIINLFAGIVISYSVFFYGTLNSQKGGFYIVPFSLTLLISMIFIFINYYIYIMIVTFHLNLKQLYKNAFIFALAGLFRNFLTSIFILIIAFIMYILVVSTPIGMLLIPLIALSLAGFIIVFNSYPLIKKLMIDPYYADLEKQKLEDAPDETEETKVTEDKTIFTDTGRRKDIKKKHFNK